MKKIKAKKPLFIPILPPFRRHKRKVYQRIIDTCGFIYQIGECGALRKPSKEVPVEKIQSKRLQGKVNYVKKCLLKYRKLTGMGRGLAAVQVGIPERFFVMYTPKRKGQFLNIINPKITKKSEELLEYPEVCMSASPIIAPVARPAWIEFKYYDEEGKKKYWRLKAKTKKGKIYNRVCQHEIDHMDGIINIDRVDSRDLILESDPKFYGQAKFKEV